MDRKYRPDKVPMESKVDAHYPGKSHNERYLNTKEAGALGDGIMGQASKVMQVNPCPNYDIGRCNYSDFQKKDTPEQAFNYQF